MLVRTFQVTSLIISIFFEKKRMSEEKSCLRNLLKVVNTFMSYFMCYLTAESQVFCIFFTCIINVDEYS